MGGKEKQARDAARSRPDIARFLEAHAATDLSTASCARSRAQPGARSDAENGPPCSPRRRNRVRRRAQSPSSTRSNHYKNFWASDHGDSQTATTTANDADRPSARRLVGALVHRHPDATRSIRGAHCTRPRRRRHSVEGRKSGAGPSAKPLTTTSPHPPQGPRPGVGRASTTSSQEVSLGRAFTGRRATTAIRPKVGHRAWASRSAALAVARLPSAGLVGRAAFRRKPPSSGREQVLPVVRQPRRSIREYRRGAVCALRLLEARPRISGLPAPSPIPSACSRPRLR